VDLKFEQYKKIADASTDSDRKFFKFSSLVTLVLQIFLGPLYDKSII